MRQYCLLGVSLVALAISACSTPNSTAYLQPEKNVRLKVPKGVQKPMQKPLYVVPAKQLHGNLGSAVSILPPGSKIAAYQALRK